ncbi:MAG: glycosyl hydrolase family 17 protein, partial [Myxococcota bacterium]
VRERLRIIAPHTSWIRTFSCSEGNELAPAVAHELGLKTLVGAWIDGDEARNRKEMDAVIELAKAGHADLIAVGNEVLLRDELPEEAIIEAIQTVKSAVPDIPVAYVDAYFLFAQRPALVAACDFLPINCYPFWEHCPLAQSFGYVKEMVRRVRAVAGDKPILIAETGWPSQGTPEGPAEPGLDNVARYALNLIPWAAQTNVPLFWFAAFDEAWKVGAEGDCGAYWGFWDAEGKSKLAT